jgi:hypothetical protein
VKVDCAACHHVALLTPVFLLNLGLSPHAKFLDLKQRVRVSRVRSEGAYRRFYQVAAADIASQMQPAAVYCITAEDLRPLSWFDPK